MKLTDPSFWQTFFGEADAPSHVLGPEACELRPLLRRYLPRASAGRRLELLEIGCYPGRFLYYFSKEFGYRVSGVDFLPETVELPARLAESGVKAEIFVSDFFSFQPGKRYDVVFSYGFVEHFSNWQEVLQRHLDLLKPEGTLVIEMPNFRRGQYWLRRLIDPNFAAGHSLEVMDLKIWKKALREKGLEVLYCGYLLTFGIWIDASSRAVKGRNKLARAFFLCAAAMHKIIAWLKIDYPNRYFSPYIAIIAKNVG
jgi:SAM-dependent methyltransferase